VTRILHTSDLHFGRPAVESQLDALMASIAELRPDAVAVSGDLTQRCTVAEFQKARAYLDAVRQVAPVVVIPGNHDVRWLGAAARQLGMVGLVGRKAHEFKYSRYVKYINPELDPALEVPGAVIAGCNTAHGISRGSLTRRFQDLGVIGHVRGSDLRKVEEAFGTAPADAARIVMIHHNPIRGASSGRHGLANTEWALRSFASLGAELVLCGHDHQEAVHNVEQGAGGLVISTSGTISNRRRGGRPSSFNLVTVAEDTLNITTHAWRDGASSGGGFAPSQEHTFARPNPTPA
jgi:3',5'-cyclic AMP phosphodiesterase CpdA